MSTALRLVRDLRENVHNLSLLTIQTRLDRIEEVLATEARRLDAGSGLARALLTLADMGEGCKRSVTAALRG